MGHDSSGQFRLAENIELPKGTALPVTTVPEGENRFWSQASEKSLTAIWDNAEDDVYAQLLASTISLSLKIEFSDRVNQKVFGEAHRV